MSEGRGSAFSAMNIVIMVSLLCLFVLAEHANAAETHIVGGTKKWTFNIKKWPEGKEFKAGDVLVFKYPPRIHNVVAVDENGYNTCKTPEGAVVLKSGNDVITLQSGLSYFICNVPGHCQGGMKIAINAE